MAIITISRGTMSGGMKLAQMLCERLNYRCISREVIVRAAKEFSVPEKKLFEAVQKGPTLIQRLGFDRERYLAYVQAALCEYVEGGNIVYHGHVGHFLLPSLSNILKIRIVGSMEQRIELAMEKGNLSRKEAAKMIEEVDHQRIKWTRFLYGADWNSPELYDLTFNMMHMDLEEVCNIIAFTVELPKYQSTTQTEKEVRDLLLCSRVKTALADAPGIRLEQIQIQTDGSKVTLFGKTHNQEMLDQVVEIASTVERVNSVVSKLEVDYHYQGIDS